ncbi:MAG: hypothetical protein ACOCP4_01095 [Candidatus Woesearchaeota archaeon]
MFKKAKNNDCFNIDNIISENQALKIQLANKDSLIRNLTSQRNYYENELNRLNNTVETFCKFILSNEYNVKQLGGASILKDLDVYKLIEFTHEDFVKQQKDHLDTIKFMDDRINQLKILVESLKEQLTYSMANNNKDISEEEVKDAQLIDNTNDEPVVMTIEKDTKGKIVNETKNNNNYRNNKNNKHKNNRNITNNNYSKSDRQHANKQFNKYDNNKNNNYNQQKRPKNIDNNSTMSKKLMLENMETYMSSMTEIMWDIVYAIGFFGYAESNEILSWMEKENKNYNKSNVLNSLTSLDKMNILSAQNISTGYRRFNIYQLTQKGDEMYKAKFNTEPTTSEINQIIKQHDNVNHGYTIKDACKLLVDMYKCESVNMNRNEISFKLENNETYIPDILGIKEGKKLFFEVELGNTPQGDFNKKCTKMMEVTKDLYFITDKEDTMKKTLEKQISMWVLNIGGKDKVQGVKVYITTMTKLSKGVFDNKFSY